MAPAHVESSTDQATLPPRIMQGELLTTGSSVLLRTGEGAAEFVNIMSILRLYRNRRVVLILFDPKHRGESH